MVLRFIRACFSRPQKRMAILLLMSLFFAPFSSVRAAIWRGYDAQVMSVQSPTSMRLGERAEVVVKMRNSGDKAWQTSGREFVSLYHWNPTKKIETAPLFADRAWNSVVRPVKLGGPPIVKGGETTLRFYVDAPSKTGTYKGDFVLAAENAAWMGGSRFEISFTVGNGPSANAIVTPTLPSASVPAALPAPSVVSPMITSSTQTVYLQDSSGRFSAHVTNSGGISWNVDAGQDLRVQIAYQNAGDVPWETYGVDAIRFVPIDQVGRSRTSAFTHPRWTSNQAVAPLAAHTSLGGDAKFDIFLRAPDTVGTYRERFALVTASGQSIPGSVIELPITVGPGTGFIATDVSDVTDASAAPISTQTQNLPAVQAPMMDGSYVATPGSRNLPDLQLLGNGRQQITANWKNIGTKSWAKMGVRLVSSEPWVKASWLMDSTWSDSRPPEATVQVLAGYEGFYSFYVKAPPKRGTYMFTFRLFADGQPVQGGDVTVSIRVTSDGVVPINDPVVSASRPSSPSVATPAPSIPPLAALPLTGDISTLPAEPLIRVGIYQPPQGRMQVTGRQSSIEVRSQGTVVCQAGQDQPVTIEYQRATSRYILSGPGSCSGSASQPYVVRASDGRSPLEVTDFVKPSGWITNASDNDFRTQLELRLSKDGKQLWVINELPVETYLKGIAETSNSSPAEFQRTLLVTARTYAMYHVNRGGTKHANEGFTVDATLDQLYRGYNIELRAPTISAAVDATRGQIVTYNGVLAITPYFSSSDGRTRSWAEVWGNGSDIPWLMSVSVPWDQGRKLNGHGVGMSATGALGMANDGKRYDEILRYFYTGTEVRRAYR